MSCIPITLLDLRNESNELLDLQLEGDSASFLTIKPEAYTLEDSPSDSLVP